MDKETAAAYRLVADNLNRDAEYAQWAVDRLSGLSVADATAKEWAKAAIIIERAAKQRASLLGHAAFLNARVAMMEDAGLVWD